MWRWTAIRKYRVVENPEPPAHVRVHASNTGLISECRGMMDHMLISYCASELRTGYIDEGSWPCEIEQERQELAAKYGKLLR